MTPRWYRRIRSALGLPCRDGACVRTGQWGSRGNTCVCGDRRGIDWVDIGLSVLIGVYVALLLMCAVAIFSLIVFVK